MKLIELGHTQNFVYAEYKTSYNEIIERKIFFSTGEDQFLKRGKTVDVLQIGNNDKATKLFKSLKSTRKDLTT